MKQTYSEKLRSPEWQKKRLEILNRDEFTCQLCSDSTTELHIHHKEYIRGNQPWEYEDSNFQTLCKHCHELVEEFKIDGETVFAASHYLSSDRSKILSVVAGLKFCELSVYVFKVKDGELKLLMSANKDSLHRFLSILNHAETLAELQEK